MAMGGRYAVLVAMVAVVSFMLVQCVERTAASYGMVEFSPPAPRGLQDEAEMAFEGEEFDDEITRRMLAQQSYYISYGSLSGNRSPCPARSGRSYYTPQCNSQGGPVRPYRRVCSQITRCARG